MPDRISCRLRFIVKLESSYWLTKLTMLLFVQRIIIKTSQNFKKRPCICTIPKNRDNIWFHKNHCRSMCNKSERLSILRYSVLANK